jgi:hypothetical protein
MKINGFICGHQRKRNTIVNSRTSGKNHTTGHSQVRWEMIWRFALCVEHVDKSDSVSAIFSIYRHRYKMPETNLI